MRASSALALVSAALMVAGLSAAPEPAAAKPKGPAAKAPKVAGPQQMAGKKQAGPVRARGRGRAVGHGRGNGHGLGNALGNGRGPGNARGNGRGPGNAHGNGRGRAQGQGRAIGHTRGRAGRGATRRGAGAGVGAQRLRRSSAAGAASAGTAQPAAAGAPAASRFRAAPRRSSRGAAAPQTARRRAAARAERRRRAARRQAARRLASATRRATRLGQVAAVTAARLPSPPPPGPPLLAARPEPRPDRSAGPRRERAAAPSRPAPERGSPVVRTVREIVEVVPGPLKAALAALGLLSLLLLGGYLFAMLRSRRLARQRRELLDEVGLLQAALLPPVPERIGAVRTSVAYRPSDGPGAGGDFYDALSLPLGRAGFVLGDVSGHGREALSRTAFMRYTLRAYLEAGLEPRAALRVGERVVGEHLAGGFATVILAVHDPRRGTLTYASAGHPSPIVVGGEPHEPLAAASCPPIGWGLGTGLRQTTIPLAAGSRALLYTDGLEEAPTGDGGMLGRSRLAEITAACDSASEVLDRVALDAVELRDDMAACMIAPGSEVTAVASRVEELELIGEDVDEELLEAFLAACEVAPLEAERVRGRLANLLRREGGAIIKASLGAERRRIEVLPREDERLEPATQRVSSIP